MILREAIRRGVSIMSPAEVRKSLCAVTGTQILSHAAGLVTYVVLVVGGTGAWFLAV